MSRHMTIAILAGLAALAMAGPSMGDTVTLKGEAYVTGPKVLLGDVADVEGDEAAYLRVIEIAPAALPGASKRLDASLVRARLRSAGVKESEVDILGTHRVLATTLHMEITRGMLSADLRDFIRREMPWEPGEAIVEVAPVPSDYVVSDGQLDIVWRPNPPYEYLGTGTFRGEILVNGELQKTLFMRASVEAFEEVVVANRGISRGEAVSPRNVRLERRALSSLRGEAYFSMEDVAGYVAKSTIQSGQVLSPRRIAAPILVRRNQVIPVETVIGALTIRTRARAQSNGAAGDLVSCTSLGTREEFVGVIRADGVLQVN